MFDPNLPMSLRPEAREYVRVCEHLLASMVSLSPLNDDERRLVDYYQAELRKELAESVAGDIAAANARTSSDPVDSTAKHAMGNASSKT
jgi:hypothetical protein